MQKQNNNMKHAIKSIYLIVNLKKIKGRQFNRGRGMRLAKVYINNITNKTK